MQIRLLLLLLFTSYLNFAQSEESSIGLSVLYPADNNSENLYNAGIAFEGKLLFDITDHFYIGGVLATDLYNVSQEGAEGELLVFIPIQASLRYYVLEYVYVNLDAGYALNVDQLGLQSDLKVQFSAGYSFDGFNIQASYHIQKQNNFNLNSFAIGAYFTI